ncbi:hypothetical protein F1737_04865 [Methanoplanus sp. FWC-SCC4]|uniref:Uncharacterized protein n=1 Tax=Methanochimaera problematica TaxID=2609417 RepID=A0AA97FD87_9EURY|nr:hypothetical protein [Methanoplanus sp. FWC-SCC4]WOF16083.1 hypothetical protein F1737_04865 [Methanoplanus sp. FWC-SCC4]
MTNKIEFVSDIEFIASIDENKDCLMNQSTKEDSVEKSEMNPHGLWFNIDVPKGHGFKSGDLIKITVEKVK